MGQHENQDQLTALVELPDSLQIGEQEFKIYPLTLGKMAMLGDAIEGILPLIKTFEKFGESEPGDFGKQFKGSLEQIAAAFVVVSTPNDGKLPEVTTDKVAFAMANLEMAHIVKVLAILRQGANFEALLKNVIGPRVKSNSPGADLSGLSSSSLNGDSTTLPGESL